MTPMWKRRQQRAYEAMWREVERKRRHERFVAGPLGWLVEVPGVLTSWGFVILLIVLLSMAWAVRALAADERQVRRDCRMDALRHCKPAIYTLDRDTIIACMVANKDKLTAACARHLWVNQ